MSKKRKTPRQEPETLGLPSGGVETHAHLDLENYAEDLDTVLARAAACGVSRIGQVFLGPEAYARGRDLFAGRPGIFFILGAHPHDAGTWDGETREAVARAFAEDSRIKALGEIGLDYHYDYAPHDVQRAVFAEQLDLARELGVPVVIHSREAWDDSFEVLEERGFAGRPLLWHCFGGEERWMRRVVDNGWYLSIPGAVTWKGMDELREAVAAAPLERLVLETDSPFLAPDPWRGKRNEPAFIGFTAQAVAEVRGMASADLWLAAAANAERFFGLQDTGEL
ncbi:TatD family hydrolase [Desulfocurvus sp. DL9XJH121]